MEAKFSATKVSSKAKLTASIWPGLKTRLQHFIAVQRSTLTSQLAVSSRI